MTRFVVLAVTAALAGCGTVAVRPYPFCSFDGVPTPEQMSSHLRKVEAGLRVVAQDPLVATLVDVQHRSWMLVRTSRRTHSAIREAWPPLACLGAKPYAGELGALKYRVCLLTVQRNLESADGIVSAKAAPIYHGAGDEIDSDSLVPQRLLWCNGWEKLGTAGGATDPSQLPGTP